MFEIAEWKLTRSLDDRDSGAAFVLELHVSGIAENTMLGKITYDASSTFIWLKSRTETVLFTSSVLPFCQGISLVLRLGTQSNYPYATREESAMLEEV
jgi:hypothetical protein